jgi:hypothetical protein
MTTSQRLPSLFQGLVLVFLVMAGACGPADTERAEPTEDPGNTEATTSEASGSTDWVGEATVGTDLGDDDTVPAAAATDRIPRGEIAFVSLAVDEPPAGAQLRVTFLGPDGQIAAEDGKRISPDADAVFVSSGPTADWATGSYQVEVWVGDEKVAETSFELVEGA